jgi:hypothetical protein
MQAAATINRPNIPSFFHIFLLPLRTKAQSFEGPRPPFEYLIELEVFPNS